MGQVTRVSVNRDGLDTGDERLWLIELPDGRLVKARSVRFTGPARSAQGQRPYGARLWIETDATVVMTDSQPL